MDFFFALICYYYDHNNDSINGQKVIDIFKNKILDFLYTELSSIPSLKCLGDITNIYYIITEIYCIKKFSHPNDFELYIRMMKNISEQIELGQYATFIHFGYYTFSSMTPILLLMSKNIIYYTSGQDDDIKSQSYNIYCLLIFIIFTKEDEEIYRFIVEKVLVSKQMSEIDFQTIMDTGRDLFNKGLFTEVIPDVVGNNAVTVFKNCLMSNKNLKENDILKFFSIKPYIKQIGN